jgi:hypothetical protein
MTLVEFLRERVDDDEEGCAHDFETANEEWYAERMLAECEAKRRLIEIAVGPWDEETIDRAVRLNQRGSTVVDEDGEEEEVAEWTTTRLLRAVAAVYADHPDYQPEWKP